MGSRSVLSRCAAVSLCFPVGSIKDEGPGRLIGVRPRAFGAQRLLGKRMGGSFMPPLPRRCPVLGEGEHWGRGDRRPTGSTTASAAVCRCAFASAATTVRSTVPGSVRGCVGASHCAERVRAISARCAGRVGTLLGNGCGERGTDKK